MNSLIKFIRDYYSTNDFIPLHAPEFSGKEKEYVNDAIDSTFVSSVGAFVNQFESDIEKYTGSASAVATVNGTSALQVALRLAGVGENHLVLTQAVTFVATCNAIHYLGAQPVFIDVDMDTLGLSPRACGTWLEENARVSSNGQCIEKSTGKIIQACVPMHTYGHPVKIDGLVDLCKKWNIKLVEDAAESLGSFYRGKHTGTFSMAAAISFNGNKIITTGGGGMVLAMEKDLGVKAKHLTTTAKVPHAYEFFHDEVGYNYRMPNINAALGVGQLEKIAKVLEKKKELAQDYKGFFSTTNLKFIEQPEHAESNYWLNSILCENKAERDEILKETNANGVMTRPLWQLMSNLPMFEGSLQDELINSQILADTLINLPSSVSV